MTLDLLVIALNIVEAKAIRKMRKSRIKLGEELLIEAVLQ
jgi:hypothetical protein